MNLSRVIDELVEDRGLDRGTLHSIVVEAMVASYQKKYPDLIFDAAYNKKTDEVEVFIEKEVVSSVTDADREISLRKARVIKEGAAIGDLLTVPFEGAIGRIEVLKAKQIIAQKIRAIEASQVYDEFKSREGGIVHGVVHKTERGGVVIKIQDQFAFLPKSLAIPNENFVVGRPIRALLREVLPVPKNESQLILDRVSEDFLRGLFSLEIPEIFDRLVEVKKIVREAGYKSKVIVVSNDPNIDPVGTCVGVGGARIKPILREIGEEKIDIIAQQDSLENLVKEALRPAEVNRVEVEDDAARVWVNEDQRALAIGKMGKNISLASRLIDIGIDLVQPDTNSAPEDLFADVLDEDRQEGKE